MNNRGNLEIAVSGGTDKHQLDVAEPVGGGFPRDVIPLPHEVLCQIQRNRVA